MQTGETPVLLAFMGLLPRDCPRSKLNGYPHKFIPQHTTAGLAGSGSAGG